MSSYKCLQNQVFTKGKYQIVPIRAEDKYIIMQWRNEQIYHLRQSKPLTEQDQVSYFENIVSKLFDQERPNQILFSYLENDVCIGYGGLVHINWIDKNAEISFIINTLLEKEFFELHWVTYLALIEQVAFENLAFHKIFTFAFDLRPHLYKAVEKVGFTKEAVLKEHYFWDGKFIDAVIHTKIHTGITIRTAVEADLMLYFEWANDVEVRKQSFNSNTINLENHTRWFKSKLNDVNSHLYVFENSEKWPIGQVRIEQDIDCNKAVIGVSIDEKYRGKGIASNILKQGVDYFLNTHKDYLIEAYIKSDNEGSIKSFLKAGFMLEKELTYQNTQSVLLIYKIH